MYVFAQVLLTLKYAVVRIISVVVLLYIYQIPML